MHLQLVAVRHPDAFDAAFATIIDLHPDALAIGDDGLFHSHLRQIFDFATTHRLPILGPRKPMAEAGSLMTYGYDTSELLQRAAVYVDKILRGASPGDLPIERPTRFELILNLKTATTLGLTFSPMVLFRADAVLK